ncbi:MAG: hypothetical protein Q7U75_13930 [Desulfobacterales bacterium]|nr:hypothetical protein [Desulfobacterales bacterium]
MKHTHTGTAVGGRVLAALAALLVVTLLIAACGGPQMKKLSRQRFKALDINDKVDVFIGEIKPPYQEVAIIETDASSFVDNDVKKKQIEQLKIKARRLGANVVQNVHILSKRVRGYTIDERVPFTAWQQGQYELYFMRGMAIRVPETEPLNLAEARPADGWVVEKLKPPPTLTQQIAPQPKLLNEPGLTTQSQGK